MASIAHNSSPTMNDLGARLLTLDEVAAWLGVSHDWVRDHATRRNPRIPVVRLGGKRALLRFRPQDVQQFIEKHLLGAGV
jgi:excisionase family DNA binding protein